MSLEFEVEWTVSGRSRIEVTWDEINGAGINPDDYPDDRELFAALDEYFQHDLSNEVVSDFEERDRPVINSVDVSGRLNEYDLSSFLEREGYFNGND